MKLLILYIVLINILSVFCIVPSESEDCKNVLNFFDNYMKKSHHTLKLPECCNVTNKYHHFECDNEGHITEIQLRYNKNNESIDFSSFPQLEHLNRLLLEGHLFKDNALPSRFFELPNLKTLQILSSNLSRVPDSISKTCGLEKLSVYNNTIIGFPEQFMNCSQLKYLDLSRNEGIEKIPDSIGSLKNLETLYIGMTGLKSMSEKVFDLNIKEFDLDGNPDLTTKIYNFKTKVDVCDFRDTNIECYEPGTCSSFIIQDSPRVYQNDTDTVYEKCHTTLGGRKTSRLILILAGVLALLLVLLGLLFCCCCCCRRKSDKEEEKDSNYDTKENIYIPPIEPVKDLSTTFIHEIESSKSSSPKSPYSNQDDPNPINNNHPNTNTKTNTNNGSPHHIIIPMETTTTPQNHHDNLTNDQSISPISAVDLDTSTMPLPSDLNLNLSPIPNAHNPNNSFSFVDTTIDNINSILPVTSLTTFNEPTFPATSVKPYDSIPMPPPITSSIDFPTDFDSSTSELESSIICHPSSSSLSYMVSPNREISPLAPTTTTTTTTTTSPTTSTHPTTPPKSPIRHEYSIGYENELNNNISLYYSDMIDTPPEISSLQDSSIRPLKSSTQSKSNIPSDDE